MVNDRDMRPLQSKRKAISALLPYAILLERSGHPKMLNTFLPVIRTSNEWEFMWRCVEEYASGLLYQASPRALVLVSPYICWDWLECRDSWVRRWACAASAAPDTERAAQSVVDTLLQIASKEELLPHIPVSIWSWLTKRPPLLAICLGRNVGTCAHVVRAVRALRDIEILKSYLLLVWSEWNHFSPSNSNSLGRPPRLGSTLTRSPVYVHPVHVSDSTLSRDTLSSSDSIPNRPPSHVIDSPSSRHPPSSSNSIPSHHTPNSPDNVSAHPPPSSSTLDRHQAHVADSALSHRISVSSDNTPSSPPLHDIPVSMPIRYSPPIPISIPILQPPILQPPTPEPPPAPVSVQTRHSSSSSNSILSHHTSSGSGSVSDHRPPPPSSTPSRHSSVSSNSIPGLPPRPVSVRISQPPMQPPPIGPMVSVGPPVHIATSGTQNIPAFNTWPLIQLPPIGPPGPPINTVAPTTPSTYASDVWPLIQLPPIGPPGPPINVVAPSTPSTHASGAWPLIQLPPIGPLIGPPGPPINIVPPSTPSLRTLDSMSDLPLHIPDNMPSSYLSGGFYEMQISIQEDFGGVGMRHHRADLLQQLDHVIGQLDRGLEYLKQHNPVFNEAYLQRTKHQYQYLREILLEMDTQSEQSYVAFNDHAPPDTHTTTIRDVSPPASVVARPEYWEPPPPTSLIP
jgi:hypothetical protein